MGRIPPMHEMYPLELEPLRAEEDTKELSPLEVYLAHKAAAAADDYDERMRARNQRTADTFAQSAYDAAHEEYMRRELAAGMPGDFADERTQYRAVGIGSLFRTIARVAHAVEEWAEGQAS